MGHSARRTRRIRHEHDGASLRRRHHRHRCRHDVSRAELLGVDIVIPDITYLKQNRKQSARHRPDARPRRSHRRNPVHPSANLTSRFTAREFTLAIVTEKLEEHGLLEKAKLHEVKAGDTTVLGPFSIEYLHVTHSTIDCVALAIRTPVGVIIHTGDFKIDHTPVDGKPFDLHAFARYGQEGVLALFSDSTNVERPGFTPSERAVVVRLEELFRAAPAKSSSPAFSSSVHRVQQVIDIARMVGRKIGFVGRSMVDNVEIAHGLGKLRIPDGSVVRPQDIRGFDPRKARRPRQRHPGRTDVRAVAHLCGQSSPASASPKMTRLSFPRASSPETKKPFSA